MFAVYPAIFYQQADGGFVVVFPDLRHLATEGDDLGEAMWMAIDCLAGYLASELEDGHELPKPTPLQEVDLAGEDDGETFPEEVGRFVTYVAVDVEEYASRHFNQQEQANVAS